MKVTQEPIRLDDLLKKYVKFEIPPYQREYSWDIEQISDLYHDIENSDEEYGHFFGSLLVYCEDEKIHPAEVIDGQQRLTTLFLLLNAIKCVLDEAHDSESVEGIKDLIYIRPKGFAKKGKGNEPKLSTGRRDNKVFRALLKDEDLKSIANRKIKSHKLLLKASEDFFDTQLKELFKSHKKDGLLRFLDKVVQTEFIVMTAEKRYDKILLFKTLNVRGLELTQSDLIKNEICRDPKGIDVEEVVDLWDEIKDILEDAKVNIDLFLFHYINSLPEALDLRKKIDQIRKVETEKEYAPFIPEKFIFDVFELKLKLISSTNQFLHDLKQAASNYVSFISPSDNNIYLTGIRVLNITKCFPLLLKGKLLLNDKNFILLAKALETISLRHSITRLDPKELEKLYYELLPKLRSDKDIHTIITDIKSHPTMKNENKFKSEFLNASPKNIASKYILYRLAASMKEGLKWGAKDIHLEHIMPKKTQGTWEKLKKKDPDFYNDNVERIGNLTLLSAPLNIGASNKDFKTKKKEYYTASGLRLNEKDLLMGYTYWDYSTIEERQKKIYDKIKDIWTL